MNAFTNILRQAIPVLCLLAGAVCSPHASDTICLQRSLLDSPSVFASDTNLSCRGRDASGIESARRENLESIYTLIKRLDKTECTMAEFIASYRTLVVDFMMVGKTKLIWIEKGPGSPNKYLTLAQFTDCVLMIFGTNIRRRLKSGIELPVLLDIVRLSSILVTDPLSVKLRNFHGNLITALMRTEYPKPTANSHPIPAMTASILYCALVRWLGEYPSALSAQYVGGKTGRQFILWEDRIMKRKKQQRTVFFFLIYACGVNELNIRRLVMDYPLSETEAAFLAASQITRLVPPMDRATRLHLLLNESRTPVAAGSRLAACACAAACLWPALKKIKLTSRIGDKLELTEYVCATALFPIRIYLGSKKYRFELADLTKIESLELSRNFLNRLPTNTFESFKRLRTLQAGCNNLRTIGDQLDGLKNLETLCLSRNELDSLPMGLAKLAKLANLDVSFNKFRTLPPVLAHLKGLKELDFSGNPVVIPAGVFAGLGQLEKLYLRLARLRELPGDIGSLGRLRFLSLDGNQLRSLPASLSNLKSLVILDLKNNRFTTAPPVLLVMASLKAVYLAGNEIVSIPAELDRLSLLILSNTQASALDGKSKAIEGFKKFTVSRSASSYHPASQRLLPVAHSPGSLLGYADNERVLLVTEMALSRMKKRMAFYAEV